jgi:AraC-like DNA-binding protein
MKEKINVVYRKLEKQWSENTFDYHSHDKFEIYYFHGGDCKYLIGDRIYQLQPDDIIIMNGLTLHRANPEKTEPYERSIIEFSQDWIRPIVNSLQVPELLIPFYKLSNSLLRNVNKNILIEIQELMKQISLQVSQQPNLETNMDSLSFRMVNGKVSTLFVQLLFKIYDLSQSKLSQVPLYESEKEFHVERVINWIDEYFTTDISLSSVADNLNISKYYMSRIFKEVTGFTVMQYLMSCRMNRAKYLLEMHPSKSVLDVAIESGFESPSHFSRFFRQQVKMTPTEYRKRNNCAISVNSHGK